MDREKYNLSDDYSMLLYLRDSGSNQRKNKNGPHWLLSILKITNKDRVGKLGSHWPTKRMTFPLIFKV